jgi:hypothetical protein
MKSILYIGASLMIGASIYGFVDYRKTARKKEFTDMYKPQETPGQLTEKKTIVPEVVPEKKKEVNLIPKKIAATGKKTRISTDPLEKISVEPVSINTPEAKENTTVEKFRKTKKRRLNTKLFSRAALREDYIDKEVRLDVPVKKVVEKKEQ